MPPDLIIPSAEGRGSGSGWTIRFLRVVGLASAVTLGVLVVAGVPGSWRLGTGESPSALPASSATESAGESAADSGTPTPSATSVALAGETPGPSASAPEGAEFLANYTVGDLLKNLEGMGLSCESVSGGIPGDATMFVLGCVGEDQSSGYRLTLTAPYWTADRISQYHIVATPLQGSADPARLRDKLGGLIASPFPGSDRATVSTWFADAVTKGGCDAVVCERAVGQGRVEVQDGKNGTRLITVAGSATTP